MNFSNIRIVLIETSHPGNIGAAARAMMNMGVSRLVLVKPRLWPAKEATSMAVNAQAVLDSAIVVDTFEAAIADCHLVIGTSARLRTMPIPLLDPSECAARVMAQHSGRQVALVFGREISGLSNDELLHCHYHVHIPVNPEYSSLNLAAAVMVLVYELRKTALALPKSATEELVVDAAAVPEDGWDQEMATAGELERFLVHLESVLIQLDFHKTEHKRPLMRRLRRLYQRVQLDKMEINILRGILTATEEVLRKSSLQIDSKVKSPEDNS